MDRELAHLRAGAAVAVVVLAVPAGAGAATRLVNPEATGSGHRDDIVAAVASARPGDVIALADGAYALPHTLYVARPGTLAAPVTIRAVHRRAAIVSTPPGTSDTIAVQASFVTISGIALDGQAWATQNGIHIVSSSHVTVSDVWAHHYGRSGIASTGTSDYLTVDGNDCYLGGYGLGWSSCISFDNGSLPPPRDPDGPFHYIITRNVVSGEYDASIQRADGNGIVVDLMGDAPASLIAENVIYQNGGRGIHVFRSSNVWVIDNTVYQNVLDDAGDWGGWRCCRRHQGNVNVGGIKTDPVRNVHLVNNLITDWTANPQSVSVNVTSFASVTEDATVHGQNSYADPPTSDPRRTDNYRLAVSPLDLGDRLVTRPTSPAVDAGIAPWRAAGLNAAQAAQLATLLAVDARGAARPQGAGWDVGAYEVR